VLRAIFRVCYTRYRQSEIKSGHISTVNLQAVAGRGRRSFTWGRKEEEFNADFYLVSRRTLEPAEWDIFEAHYLKGADFNRCCQKLKMDRGNFFHKVYRIQQKLGRTFAELKPYALYPLDEYFSGSYQAPEQTAGSLAVGGRHVGHVRLAVPLAA
jgi:hypothetical protein